MSSNPPGYITPTVISYPNGAGNPRDAAISTGQQMNAKQSSINAIGGRRKRTTGKRTRRYGGGVAVPQYQMNYTTTAGPGTNPNDQISNLTSNSMQSAAWKVNDHHSTKMSGGKRKRKRRKTKKNKRRY